MSADDAEATPIEGAPAELREANRQVFEEATTVHGSEPPTNVAPRLQADGPSLATTMVSRPSEGAPVPLDGLAYGIDHLDAIVAYHAADAQVHAAWVRADAGVGAAEIARRLAEVYRATQSAAHGLGALSATVAPASVQADPFVTIETEARLTFLRRVRSYVVACLFDAAMPMGMARLMANRIANAIAPELPLVATPETRPFAAAMRTPLPPQPIAASDLEAAKTLAAPTRGTDRPPAPRPTLTELDRARRLLTFLEARAPEAHVARLRVALRTHLTPVALEHPETLGADAIVLIETAVEEILGIDRSELRVLV